MASRTPGAAVIDGPAIALSSLCLIHCLALPIASTILPIAGMWFEAEWVHKAFVIAALPFSVMALLSKRVSFPVSLLIVAGAALLASGAFVEAWHELETELTVIGGMALALGHALRWRSAHNVGH